MLFSQHNGIAQAVSDQSEVEVLQNLACGIGPRVDGIAASLSLPQSMGAFSTAGAQGACGGRGQQMEQHTPTTTRGLGATLTPTISPTFMKLAIDPAKLAIIQQAAAMPEFKVMATDAKLYMPGASPEAPSAPAPATPAYPPGTITAFNATTNMWRVAVPLAGLGIFDGTAAFTEVAPVASPPAGATQVSPTQFAKQTNTLPLYKKWQFWAAVAGGVAVIGTGTVLLFRRKRAA